MSSTTPTPSPGSTPATSTSVTTPDPPSTTTLTSVDPGDVVGFSIDDITVGGSALIVAVADTAERRRRGLMFVEDLGDLDGMLFVFPEERAGGFWMKNTVIPLDIAFFDSDGALVDLLTMDPCREEPCPTYTPSASYRYALEAPRGALFELPDISQLEL